MVEAGFTWSFFSIPTKVELPKKKEPEVKSIIVNKTFANGRRYAGTVKDNKAGGYGEYYLADGSLEVKGFWQNNQIIRG